MKKTLLSIIAVLLILAGCKNTTNDPIAINKKIAGYEKQVADLNLKISDLKKLINTDSSAFALLVKLDTISSQDYQSFISLTANVEAENYAFISPQMNGQVIKIYVTEGQRVSSGTILAKLNDDVLQRNLAQLQTNLLLADSLYEKQKTLYEQKVVSQVQYLQAKNQKESLEKNIEVVKTQIQQTKIIAPFSGIIDRIDIKEGEIASPGKPIIQIVNLSNMLARADVSEKYLPFINIGDKAELTFTTYPDMDVNSTISQKGNIIDPSTRTFWIKLKFNNINEKIKPNMLTTIKLKNFEAKNVVVVPSNILAQDINGWYIYTAISTGNTLTAKKQYVQLGNGDTEKTIVTKGLNVGDIIITEGYNQIAEGSKLTVK